FTIDVQNVNEKPVISYASWRRTDIYDTSTAQPFKDKVSFTDNDVIPLQPAYDNFTVKVTLDDTIKGGFDAAVQLGWKYEGGVYSLTGSLAYLQEQVGALTFNPRERLDAVPGTYEGAETTTFHIELIDNGPGSGGSIKAAENPDFQVVSLQTNHAPTSLTFIGTRSIDENVSGTTYVIGTLKGVDPNIIENASLRYYFVDSGINPNSNPHGYFSIGEFDGKVRLATGAPLNFEANDPLLHRNNLTGEAWYTLDAVVFDTAGNSKRASVDVYVNNITERPVIVAQDHAETIADNNVTKPFTGVTFSDEDAILEAFNNFTVTVALDDWQKGGFTSGSLSGWSSPTQGVYKFSGDLSQITTAIQNLVFDPRDRTDVLPGTAETTTFHITLKDNGPASGGQFALENPLITVTSEQHNLAPASVGLQSRASVNEDLKDSAIVLGRLVGVDGNAPETPLLKYYFQQTTDANPHNYFQIDQLTGEIRLASGVSLDFEAQDLLLNHNAAREAWYDLKVLARDPSGLEVTNTVQVFVNNINSRPTDIKAAGQTVVTVGEYGTIIGNLTATDADFDNLSWAIDSTNPQNIKDMFQIVSDGAQGFRLEAKPNMLDYESATQDGNGRYYIVKVKATDVPTTGTTPLSATQDIKIYVTNVNEAPSKPIIIQPGAIAEMALNGSVAARVGLSVDPDLNDSLTYEFASTGSTAAGGRFSIDPDGTIRVANGSLINYEATTGGSGEDPYLVRTTGQTYYLFTVVAKDRFGTVSQTTEVKILVTDVNEAPKDLEITTTTGLVFEGANTGRVVHTVGATDPDFGQAVTYSLDAGHLHSDKFTLSADGKLSLRPNMSINYEASAGDDPYLLIDNTQPAGLQRYYQFWIIASDNGTPSRSSAAVPFRVVIGNVNETPSASTLSGGDKGNGSIDENALNPIVGTVAATDPDTGNGTGLTYTLVSDLGGRFTLDRNTGILRYNGAANFEAGSEDQYLQPADTLDAAGRRYYKVQVKAEDAGTQSTAPLSSTTEIKVYVNDIDEAPSTPSPLVVTVAENTSGAIGQLAGAIDPEGTAVHYGWATDADANPGGLFELLTDGTIRIASPTGLNFEAAAPIHRENGEAFYLIKVVALDAGGKASAPQTVKILVTDVNERPTAIGLSSSEILENSDGHTVVGILGAVDPDFGDAATMVYEIDPDHPSDKFEVAVVNGQWVVRLKAEASVNFEKETFHEVWVIGHDKNGGPGA
ncbi:MAG: cadherin domain-containing protein, partial [Microvirga sp.]